MKKIKCIFIILTPFQRKNFESFFFENFQEPEVLIIRSNIVDFFPNFNNQIVLDIEPFSIFHLIKKPFTEFFNVKKDIESINKVIYRVFNDYNVEKKIDLYIGSEKDNFTQIFLNYLNTYKRVSNIIAVEEGTGYYKKEKFKDKVFKKIFPFFSLLFFNNKINYVKCLGTDKRINIVYSRFPKLLPYKSGKKIYKKLKFLEEDSRICHRYDFKKNSVLFFSFPEQDYNKSFSFKKNIYLAIIKKHLLEGQDLFIKPHPRENQLEILKFIKPYNNVHLIDQKILGEKIDFKLYSKIINFSSSIILHLLTINFPTERIITIGYKKKPMLNLFHKTNFIYYKTFLYR